jgi:restriction system protein
MDLGPAQAQIFKYILIIVPIIILLGVFKSAWFKGIAGEAMVNLVTRFLLNRRDYHLLRDVTLSDGNGTTQIDHLIVSRYGLFVVETKNMKGWIYGGEREPRWTQKIYRHTNTFQNPLHQNHKHVKTLEALLGLDAGKLFSVVVFTGNATFKTPMPAHVTHILGYTSFIKSKQEPLLSEDAVREIIDRIESNRFERSTATARMHRENLLAARLTQDSTGVLCPKCGSPMVLRTARKGSRAGQQFWGCSRFPHCRGVRAHNATARG